MHRSTSTCAVFIVVLGLAMARPAAAEDAPAEDPEQILDRAVALYRGGEFDRSRDLLKRVLQLRPPAKLRARAHLHLGLNEAAAGRLSETRRHFAEALRLDPAIEVKRSHLKTAVVEILDQLRREMRGTLVIEANVVRATVVVDGQTVGTSPYRGQHEPGRHRIEVRPPASARAAYAAHRAEVVLAAGATHQLSVQLLPLKPVRAERPDDGDGRGRGLRRWAWVASAGALAATGTAVGLGVVALDRRDDADAFARTGDPSRAEDQLRHGELVDASERMVTGTNIAWGLAGALAVTSAALFAWDLLASR
jgi:tetratricopeptide (TPR) repeat protein